LKVEQSMQRVIQIFKQEIVIQSAAVM